MSDRGKDGDRQTYRQTSKRKETDKTDDQCVSTKLSFENFAKCWIIFVNVLWCGTGSGNGSGLESVALLMLESLTSNNHLWALHCWMPTPLALTIVLDVADVQIRFSHNYLGALKVFYNVLYLGAFQVLESGFSHNYLRALPVLESGISQNRLGTLQELDFDISHFYLGTLQVLECEKLCEIAILLSYNFARYETLVGNPTGGGGGGFWNSLW